MKLNRTTLRTIDILKLVSKKPDGITLDEICEKLNLPKTKRLRHRDDIGTDRDDSCGQRAEAALYHWAYGLQDRH